MALNFFEMFASLRMGIDVLTTTPWEEVPHALQPGYVPVYTVRDEEGKVAFCDLGVDESVNLIHTDLRTLTLYEDEYPVFTAT